MTGRYLRGRNAELAVANEMFGIGKVPMLYMNKDSNGQEIAQIIVVNNKTFRCPDLQILGKQREIVMRIEVKSFNDFSKEKELPFKTKSDILVISKEQFEDYFNLEREEEVPIRIVFAIGDSRGLNYNYFWSSLSDMINFPRREGLYTWKWDGRTEECYFFKSDSFNNNIRELQ